MTHWTHKRTKRIRSMMIHIGWINLNFIFLMKTHSNFSDSTFFSANAPVKYMIFQPVDRSYSLVFLVSNIVEKLWCKGWKPSFKAALLIVSVKSLSFHFWFLSTLHPACKHLFFCESLFRHRWIFRNCHQSESHQHWFIQLDEVLLISSDLKREEWLDQQ